MLGAGPKGHVLGLRPDLLFSTKCRELSMMRGVGSKKRPDVWNDLKSIFRRDRVRSMLPQIPEDRLSPLVILAASRCVVALPWRKPTIGHVADLSHLSRNTVGDAVKILLPVGLVKKEHVGRSELIEPTELGDLYSDLTIGYIGPILAPMDKVNQGLKLGSVDNQVVEGLETLESALDLVKNIYPRNTLNYEVYDGLHDKLIQLIAFIRSGQNSDATKIAQEVTESLSALEESRAKVAALGVQPILLEDTGERVGRGRVFRPLRRR